MAAKTMVPGEERPNLARDYGLDINMADSDLAASTVASREYQKRCNHLYKEFLKNMNGYLKEEKDIRKVLAKLNKEKITNMKYSLYRSAGEDLFATAKQRRKILIDTSCMPILSPLIYDDSRLNTPWGLDPIIDEDLIRPQTAPTKSGGNDDYDTEYNESYEDRPKTVSIANFKTLVSDVTNREDFGLNYDSHYEAPSAPPNREHSERVRFRTPPLHIARKEATENKPNPEEEEEESEDEDIDGVVDTKVERTRARKITVKADKFSKMSAGIVEVKLKNKDGDFILKPINANFTPNSIDSLFMAKDPTKERMALVRKKTSFKSGTVAAELKVNNRIAIKKSLMGLTAKKTTVAEIFDHARDRKTKHFRIILKNPPPPATKEKWTKAVKTACITNMLRKGSMAFASGNTQNDPQSSETNVKKYASMLFSKSDSPGTFSNSQSCVIDDTRKDSPEKMQITVKLFQKHDTPRQNENTETPLFRTSSIGSRRGMESRESGNNVNRKSVQSANRSESAMSFVRSSSVMSTTGNQDPLSLSNSRLRVQKNQVEPDSRSQTPLNRSQSAMSTKIYQLDNMQLKGTDKDMTEMIRHLVEGRGNGENVPGVDSRPASRMSRSKTPKRMYTPDTVSETSLSYDARKLMNTNMTRNLIKEQQKKDREYAEQMETMKRRMVMGGKSVRRGSIRPR